MSLKQDVSKKKESPLFQRPRVPNPAPLPKLTEELKGYKKNDEVYQKQGKFIAFWASHLESLTDGKPTPTDYANYASTIVQTFPELKGGEGGYVS